MNRTWRVLLSPGVNKQICSMTVSCRPNSTSERWTFKLSHCWRRLAYAGNIPAQINILCMFWYFPGINVEIHQSGLPFLATLIGVSKSLSRGHIQKYRDTSVSANSVSSLASTTHTHIQWYEHPLPVWIQLNFNVLRHMTLLLPVIDNYPISIYSFLSLNAEALTLNNTFPKASCAKSSSRFTSNPSEFNGVMKVKVTKYANQLGMPSQSSVYTQKSG